MKPAALAGVLDSSHLQDSQQNAVLAGTCDYRQTSLSRTPGILTGIVDIPPLAGTVPPGLVPPGLRCTCPDRQQVTPWRSFFGFRGISTVTQARHRKSCPWASSSRSFQIARECRLSWYFLTKAIRLGFSMTCGAGGFSFAPNLSIIPVATSDNPAFKIIRETVTCHVASRQALMLRLRQLFVDGRASPFDIDEGGGSLIHVGRSI